MSATMNNLCVYFSLSICLCICCSSSPLLLTLPLYPLPTSSALSDFLSLSVQMLVCLTLRSASENPLLHTVTIIDNHGDIISWTSLKIREKNKLTILLPNNYWTDKFPTSYETKLAIHVSCQKHINYSNPLKTFIFNIEVGHFRPADRGYICIRCKPTARVVKCCADKWSIFQTKKHPKF